ncbi:hypothetical protein, partial [Brucella lupini]|uniref:hypothetical protein n=1 Tax=Brucella lupini TaxID=255457 RepID=UPI0035BC880D
GAETLSCFARNGGVSRQGMKVLQSRCGIKSEAKPFSGQTCPIEPAYGAPPKRRRDMTMANRTVQSPANGSGGLQHLPELL